MGQPAGPARLLRTPALVALIVAAIVVPLTLSGFIWARKGVTVIVDGQTAYHRTQASTVSELLGEVGVEVADGDLVIPAPDETIADGAEVIVRQAVHVILDCEGETIELPVLGSTVADALVAAGLDPTVGLHVSPALDVALSTDLTITVSDVFLRVVREEAELTYAVIEEPDPDAVAGTRSVARVGKPGRVLRVYEVVVTGGVEGARYLVGETVLEPAEDEVVRVGTKAPTVHRPRAAHAGALASRPAPSEGRQMKVTATAYTPWDPGCGGIAVINRKIANHQIPAGWGIIAIDPDVIPFGTKVYVPGYGYAVAADTGGAIKGNKIDVCFWSGGEAASTSAARSWGRRTVTITILD